MSWITTAISLARELGIPLKVIGKELKGLFYFAVFLTSLTASIGFVFYRSAIVTLPDPLRTSLESSGFSIEDNLSYGGSFAFSMGSEVANWRDAMLFVFFVVVFFALQVSATLARRLTNPLAYVKKFAIAYGDSPEEKQKELVSSVVDLVLWAMDAKGTRDYDDLNRDLPGIGAILRSIEAERIRKRKEAIKITGRTLGRALELMMQVLFIALAADFYLIFQLALLVLSNLIVTATGLHGSGWLYDFYTHYEVYLPFTSLLALVCSWIAFRRSNGLVRIRAALVVLASTTLLLLAVDSGLDSGDFAVLLWRVDPVVRVQNSLSPLPGEWFLIEDGNKVVSLYDRTLCSTVLLAKEDGLTLRYLRRVAVREIGSVCTPPRPPIATNLVGWRPDATRPEVITAPFVWPSGT